MHTCEIRDGLLETGRRKEAGSVSTVIYGRHGVVYTDSYHDHKWRPRRTLGCTSGDVGFDRRMIS